MTSLENMQFPVSHLITGIELAEEKGLPGKLLLAALEVDEALLSKPDATISGHHYKKMIELGLRMHQDVRPFSLVLAEKLTFTSHGLLGLAVVSSQNILEALELGSRYASTTFPAISVSYEIADNKVIIESTTIPELDQISAFVNETTAFAIMLFSNFLTSPVTPERIEFTHEATHDTQIYESFFKCPVLFGQPKNLAVISQSCLNVPMKNANMVTLALLKPQLEASLKKQSINTWSEKVRLLWLEHAQKHHFLSLDEMAQMQNITARTLARKLEREESSYQQLISGIKTEMAIEYLKEGRKSNGEIAYLTGFKETTAFYRAFKKATGKTPNSFRT